MGGLSALGFGRIPWPALLDKPAVAPFSNTFLVQGVEELDQLVVVVLG